MSTLLNRIETRANRDVFLCRGKVCRGKVPMVHGGGKLHWIWLGTSKYITRRLVCAVPVPRHYW